MKIGIILSTFLTAVLLTLRIIGIGHFNLLDCFLPMIISYGSLTVICIFSLPLCIKAFRKVKEVEEFQDFVKDIFEKNKKEDDYGTN